MLDLFHLFERRENLPCIGHYEQSCNDWGWVRLKLGNESSSQISHVGGKGLSPRALYWCFLKDMSRESDPK